MKMRCFACGIEKDLSVKEAYPFPHDGLIDEPIEPLMVLECEWNDWRAAVVCHQCFHRLDPDMWISAQCWRGLNPLRRFEDLPRVAEDRNIAFLVETYAQPTLPDA